MNVLGGVHHRAGNAPRSATYITAPSSSTTDLNSFSPSFTYGPRPTCSERRRRRGQQEESKTATLWFGDIALARRGTGSATAPVSLRRPHPLSTLQTKVRMQSEVNDAVT